MNIFNKKNSIEQLFGNICINNNGQILLDKCCWDVYKVKPMNISTLNDNMCKKIYSLYYSCVKAMPDSFQIMSYKEKINMDKSIEDVKKKLQIVKSNTLKQVMENYILKLQQLSLDEKNMVTKYCFFVPSKISKEYIYSIYKELKSVGIVIERVECENESKQIFEKISKCK